ncbi:MAG: hypothetical protein AAFX79_03445 [Planctomycetota bacterium]
MPARAPQVAASERLWSALALRDASEEPLKGLDRVAAGLQGRAIRRRSSRSEAQRAAAILAAARALRDHSEAAFDREIEEMRATVRGLPALAPGTDGVHAAFAIAVEAVRRCLGLTLYPEQVTGALVLSQGAIAEMATGEGKTVTAILPAALAGWTGRGVHVATVNDYLAKRDAEICGPVYRRLGLRVGVLGESLKKPERRSAYDADVTYGADKQFIFDFLRDRLSSPLAPSVTTSVLDDLFPEEDDPQRSRWPSAVVQRGLHVAIVDEADSVLIDEAATPAIISLPAPGGHGEAAHDHYRVGVELARALERGRDYRVDKRMHKVHFTRAGRERLAELAERLPPFWSGPRRREELVNQALTAVELYARDDDYMVREKADDAGEAQREIAIVDRSTGRVLEGRQWQLGLHQAIEAKEGLEPTEQRHTAARVSYQRYFGRYRMLSGMSGTAWEVAPELWRTYGVRVVRVPTHRPVIRKERPDRVSSGGAHKFETIASDAQRAHAAGQPVLVGTRSIRDSERVATLLRDRGLSCRVLNARHEAAEASIIEQAGEAGAITVATNMAGRGTDIKIDGAARDAGGLLVLATDRHHERRVDRQLFGRSGRQGDPGEARAYVALDDEMVRRYGPPPLRWLARACPEPLRSPLARLLVVLAQRAATRRWQLIREESAKIDAWVDYAFHQQSR